MPSILPGRPLSITKLQKGSQRVPRGQGLTLTCLIEAALAFPNLSGCSPQDHFKNRALAISLWKLKRALSWSILILKHLFSKMVNF